MTFLEAPVIHENRTKSSFPELPTSLESARGYTRKLNDYLFDNFPARVYLISWINHLRYQIGYSSISKVFVGYDGWLFYNSGDHFSQLRQNSAPTKNVTITASALVSNYLRYKRDNIDFLFISPPNKEIIYPEFIPTWLQSEKYFSNSMLISNEISRNTDAVFYVDMIDPMQRLKLFMPSILMYSKFDTHWTDKGALLAYLLILNHWKSIDNTKVPSLSLSDTSAVAENNFTAPKDVANMLGIGRYVDSQYAQITEVQTFQPKSIMYLTKAHNWDSDKVINTGNFGPTLLLIGDSFSTNLIPLLARNFGRIVFSHHQNGFFRDDLIEKYHPSYIILEVIESGAVYVK